MKTKPSEITSTSQSIQHWLCNKTLVALCSLVCLFCIGPQPGFAAPVLTTTIGPPAFGSNWVLNTGIRLWYIEADVQFASPPPSWSAPVAGYSSNKTKNDLGLKVNATTPVFDPAGSGANGYGTGYVDVTNIGVASISYDWGTTAYAVASNLPKPTGTSTFTSAAEKDPIQFNVGSAGSSLVHSLTLDAGTQVQAAVPGAGLTPHVMVDGRFGLGAYGDKPDAFWGHTAPPGILDMFHISMWENAGHHIDASVQFDSGNADFAFGFSQTADEIAQAIRDASWTLNGGEWTLNSTLSLGDVDITSFNQDDYGAISTIGDMATDQALAVAPEPGSLLLLGSAVLGISGMLRKQLHSRI